MISCGSQVAICDLPIHFDNYRGCTHGCKYCFVKRRTKNLSDVEEIKNSYKSLENFIKGKRQASISWCDWDIPIHWGGMSDPFQPIESEIKSTYKILQLLAETQYPVIISTKGRLCIEPEYLQLLSKCNVVMQISCVSNFYDNIEKGAPTYKERLKIIDKLSSNVKRVLVRAQPYLPDVKTDILRNSLKDFSNSGAYGVIFEGMKYYKKPLKCKYELEKIGADYCYNKDLLKSHFLLFKEKAHELNLKFYCGENRLRALGDSLCCCGVSDLPGFKVNEYNCNHLLNGDIKQPTGTMCKPGTGRIIHIIDQGCGTYEAQKKMTFKDFILSECYEPRTFKSLGK